MSSVKEWARAGARVYLALARACLRRTAAPRWPTPSGRRRSVLVGLRGQQAAQRVPDPGERLRGLRRVHEDLVRLALGELRQHLQILIAQQLLVGVAGVDRREDRRNRLRLALRTQDRRLTRALGGEHGSLLAALRGEDRRLLGSLGSQNRGATVTLRAHLLLHRLHDVRRRVDGLDLDAVD